MAHEDHAFVVGINTYPDLGSLGGPANDALDFREWLLAPDGGNVPRDNVHLFVSPAYAQVPPVLDADPRAEQIEKKFLELLSQLQQSGVKARRLYLYLAGHGFSKEVDEAALLMANAAKGMSTILHIPGRAYANRWAKTAFFDEVVLFMDCCREDFKMTQPRPPVFDDISGNAAAETFFGFAAKWSRASREGPWGPSQQMRGIFTLGLLAGLRGGATRDANGQVSHISLADFVYNYVAKSAVNLTPNEKAQEPQFTPSNLMHAWKFNAPNGEAAENAAVIAPAGAGGVDLAVPPAFYVLTVHTNNGTTYQLTDGKAQIPPNVQAAGTYTWHLPQGYYKLLRSDGAMAWVEAGGMKETLDVPL